MKEECLICKAPLEYLSAAELMECAICHKQEQSRTRCVNGHFVCDTCHTAGLDSILSLCLTERSVDPLAILERMMSLDFCHMHGPEHHVMVGAALLTACKNAGGRFDLSAALSEMISRGSAVPGGVCGFWGACGAGISTGIYVSILTEANPLTEESWGLANRMTARALSRIGAVGGPRCCKRDSYLAVQEAVAFTAEHLGISMSCHSPICSRSVMNNQCLRSSCPFHPVNAVR